MRGDGIMAYTVLITGGTRGIGRACSLKFLKLGYNVCAVYEKDGAAAKKLEEDAKNPRLKVFRCDVSDYVETEKLFSEVQKTFGGVDILVNNAGISQIKMLCDTTRTDWDRMFSVNVGSMYNTIRLAHDYMVHRKKGSIVNVSSMWGICGASCEAAYSASKAAVIGLTKALAKELGPSGIRVNCVAPGVIDTEMNAHLSSEDIEALKEETPLCRIGTADEAADAVVFLAGDSSSFITGQVLSPTGGMV